MFAAQQVLHVSLLTCFLNRYVCEDSPQIKKEPGENVLLHCQCPRDAAVVMLKWIRPDLESEGFVYFVRENRAYEDFQHESFHGRVELRDPTMKNGDVSVYLKNISINDSGTYQCYVGNEGSSQLINTSILIVEPGHREEGGHESGGDQGGGGKDGEGEDGGNNGVFIWVTVVVVVFLLLVVTGCFVTNRKSLVERFKVSFHSSVD